MVRTRRIIDRENAASGGARTSACAAGARGYSLIELLTVIAIVAILAGIATPQFSGMIAANAIASNANLLVAHFDLARSEALARNSLVVVCRSANVRQTTPSCSVAAAGNVTAADWASGWLMFAKPQGVGVMSDYVDGTDVLLRRVEAESAPPSGARALLISSPSTGMVAWTSSGLKTVDALAPVPVFTIDYRDPSISVASTRQACVVLSVIGRARVGRWTGSACDAS